MKTDEIRSRFLRFFQAMGHKIVASDSLVPAHDPSLLFTGAGMNQFKEQFMGHNVTFRRVVSSQKCLRTADLENVGRTAGHHTFFEMLGNFSFGDYFKKEAIGWAWEFMTQELKLPKEKLSVSVFEEDQEAYAIWLEDIKVPAKKILKMGDKDNFWPSEARKNGPNGPCGPCSEIYYSPDGAEPLEVWNLVFTQFERKDAGVLTDLPSRNIDTGMGLERLASVMQNVRTNFEIDIFVPIIEEICRDLRYKKGGDKIKDSHVKAIADHVRAVVFAISDGVYPSNEDRGFVIRKLIRRSTQRGLGVKKIKEPFLYKLVQVVAKVMKEPYPEIEKKRETISQILKGEEERFLEIILEVVPLMKEEFVKIKNSGMQKIDADLAFRYSDEKGVPVDFQREVAQELGLKIDEAGFEKFLKEQKERSRAKSKISKDIFAAPAGLARKKDEEWDEASKQKIRANHTATHLLHAALRRVLGEHAAQSGSLVYPQRLRFDFTHPKKTEKDEIAKIEELVNENIIAAQEVAKDIMSIDEARKSGAIALFGEKYADQVTVRTIGGFSKELCGGDHVKNTKEIRIFKVTQESSVSAGTRRIEAVTGDAVYEWILAQKENLRTRIADTLKTLDPGSELNKASAQKLQDMDKLISSKNKETVAYADIQKWETLEAEAVGLIERINAEKKKLQKAQSKENERALGPLAEQLTKNAKKTADVNIISGIVQNKDMAALRVLSDSIIKKTPSCVVLLGSGTAEKVNLVLAVSQDLIKKGLSSQELIKPIAACVGGSGGGRPEFAQAGGKEVSKLKEAITMIDNLIKEKLA